jgi:hypothetical protein
MLWDTVFIFGVRKYYVIPIRNKCAELTWCRDYNAEQVRMTSCTIVSWLV